MPTQKPQKPRKLKISADQELTKKELKQMFYALETAFYDSYGDNKQSLLRLANIVAEAADINPFVPDED